jgi:hypothetical protein
MQRRNCGLIAIAAQSAPLPPDARKPKTPAAIEITKKLVLILTFACSLFAEHSRSAVWHRRTRNVPCVIFL